MLYTASGKLTPTALKLDQVLPGQVTVAELHVTGANTALLLASVHAGTKSLDPSMLPTELDPKVGGSHTTKIYPIDLIRHELTALAGGRRFIIGGDLNLSVRFDDLHTRGSDLFGNVEWFSKVREAGWWNAHRKFHAGDQRTLFRPGKPDEHFQIDHIFTDRSTWAQLSGCEVLAVPYLDEFTDHAPLALSISDD